MGGSHQGSCVFWLSHSSRHLADLCLPALSEVGLGHVTCVNRAWRASEGWTTSHYYLAFMMNTSKMKPLSPWVATWPGRAGRPTQGITAWAGTEIPYEATENGDVSDAATWPPQPCLREHVLNKFLLMWFCYYYFWKHHLRMEGGNAWEVTDLD